MKTKIDSEYNETKKARLVIQDFEDSNTYDLKEIYAPVTRLSPVRAALVFANKYKLIVYQLDVKSAFLNSLVKEEIYMVIPDGIMMSVDY